MEPSSRRLAAAFGLVLVAITGERLFKQFDRFAPFKPLKPFRRIEHGVSVVNNPDR
jgi:hypothetical protein